MVQGVSSWRALLRYALGFALFFVLSAGVGQAQEVVELRSALATVTVDGVQTRHPVALPYHWDQLHSGKQGWVDFFVDLELEQTPSQPWGMFIPRVGNAFEVWVNAALMHRSGDMAQFGGADYAKIPRYVALPLGLHAGHNTVLVRIRADIGRKGGVAPLTLGPVDAVYPLYYKAYRARGTGSLVVMIICLVVALAALTLWWTQAHRDAQGRIHRDPMYLVAAVGELAWAFRVGDAIVERPPVVWNWWGALIVAAAALWAMGMALFCAYAAGWQPRRKLPWVYPWMGVFLVAGVASSLLALAGMHAFVLTAWYATMFVLFGAFLAWYSYTAVRSGTTHHQVMAVVLGINVLVGVYDLYMLRVSDAYGVNSLQRFSSVLFGVALGVIVFQRFRAAHARAQDLTRTLEARVAEKELALEQSYARMGELMRQQERSAERGRILRDMHDGVGMHLSVALRQVQSGDVELPVLEGVLHEGLDQLKLSIDALNVPTGDVVALLASLRYRLEPRLRSAGLTLEWMVDDVDPVGALDDKAMRHLQFVLYGAFSNVLQHSRACKVGVQVQALADGVRLAITDDGCGFDAKVPLTRGLRAMQDRIVSMGGHFGLHSEPGHTVVEILLPRARSGT